MARSGSKRTWVGQRHLWILKYSLCRRNRKPNMFCSFFFFDKSFSAAEKWDYALIQARNPQHDSTMFGRIPPKVRSSHQAHRSCLSAVFHIRFRKTFSSWQEVVRCLRTCSRALAPLSGSSRPASFSALNHLISLIISLTEKLIPLIQNHPPAWIPRSSP